MCASQASRRQTGRLLVAGLVVAAVFGLLLLQAEELRATADRRVGIFVDQGDGGIAVTHTVPELPAAQAGLLAGDVIVAIDGVPTPQLGDYDLRAAQFGRGRPAVFEVRRGGQSVLLPVLPGAPFPWMRFGATALAVLAHLGLGLLVLFQRSNDLRARLLMVLTAAIAIELSLPSQAVSSHTAIVVLIAAVFPLLSGIEIGVELHLASLIPARHRWVERHPLLIPAYYVFGILLGGIPGITALVEDIGGWDLFPWSSSYAQSVLDYVGLPLWAGLLIALLGTQAVHHGTPEGRHQAGLVLLGSLPWALWVWVSTSASVLGRSLPEWVDQVWPLLVLCYPVAVFVAIFRYHLFDLELVVRRSLVYTALTSTLLLVFYATLGAGSAVFSQAVGNAAGMSSVWVVSAATLLLGLLFAPLRTTLQQAIDRRFFPERQALRQQLTSVAGELPALGKLPTMARHLVERLGSIFGVRSATLLLADPKTGLLVTLASTEVDPEKNFDQSFLLSPHDPGVAYLRQTKRPLAADQLAPRSPSLRQRLDSLHAELAVPLLGPSDLVGVLLLGRRDGGPGYRAEEVELLELLSHHVATVFENARLFESATYESLTGLLRREGILEALEREHQRALRYRRPLTIGMADLDHFKQINDRHGHLVGDALLKRLAQTLQGELRSTDAIGRYGGEEFLLVLPETDLAAAARVAEKIRLAVERSGLPLEDGTQLHATVSIGLASVSEQPDGSLPTVRDLIAAADRALYQAKRAGRNRVEPAILPRVGS
jgi:diguanylate cyclase (GGDEF)-like protein